MLVFIINYILCYNVLSVFFLRSRFLLYFINECQNWTGQKVSFVKENCKKNENEIEYGQYGNPLVVEN